MDAYAAMQEMLADLARQKSAQDGGQPGPVHVVSAYNHLCDALRHEYDVAMAQGAALFSAPVAEASEGDADADDAKPSRRRKAEQGA